MRQPACCQHAATIAQCHSCLHVTLSQLVQASVAPCNNLLSFYDPQGLNHSRMSSANTVPRLMLYNHVERIIHDIQALEWISNQQLAPHTGRFASLADWRSTVNKRQQAATDRQMQPFLQDLLGQLAASADQRVSSHVCPHGVDFSSFFLFLLELSCLLLCV